MPLPSYSRHATGGGGGLYGELRPQTHEAVTEQTNVKSRSVTAHGGGVEDVVGILAIEASIKWVDCPNGIDRIRHGRGHDRACSLFANLAGARAKPLPLPMRDAVEGRDVSVKVDNP